MIFKCDVKKLNKVREHFSDEIDHKKEFLLTDFANEIKEYSGEYQLGIEILNFE